MPTQNSNRDTTWFIDAADQTWTLARKATISVSETWGIYEGGFDDTAIRVLGRIDVTGDTFAGVYISGAATQLEVGGKASIKALGDSDGVYSAAAGADITNRGLIQGGDKGIEGAIWNDIQNYGTIKGATGISQMGDGAQIYNYGRIQGADYGIVARTSGAHLENAKGAEILAGDTAVTLQGLGEGELINRGTIRSQSTAILNDDSILTVINKGRIIGDILLGGGNDFLDTRKGSIDGTVLGGSGSDTYYVGKARIDIAEAADVNIGGYDMVHAGASYRMAANLEDLRLLGRKDINGTGNASDNQIHGNAGDNVLKGGAGNDRIFGNAGNDTLTGDAGNDWFIFSDGHGVDRITDFTDGADRLQVSSVQSQAEFDALDIRQVRSDVVIDFGGGDKLVLEDVRRSDLDLNDFVII